VKIGEEKRYVLGRKLSARVQNAKARQTSTSIVVRSR